MNTLMKVLSHPVTLFNLIIVGFLTVVEVVHTHAHYRIEQDVHGHVHKFCKKNPVICVRMSNDE
jgi:hypothetical protein